MLIFKSTLRWNINYYNRSVFESVSNLPKTLRAKYIAITDMMIKYGPDLGMPHTRAMSKGLFEIRLKGKEGIARIFYCI